MENKNKNTNQYNNLYEQYHRRIENLTNLYDARSLHFEMMEEKGDILKPILPKLRAEYTKKARALRDQERAADNGVITEKREKDISVREKIVAKKTEAKAQTHRPKIKDDAVR